MAEKITAVVAALLRENDRFLVFQRPADKARGLLWEFAGGKCEPGDRTILDAMQPAVGFNWGARNLGRVKALEKCCFAAVAFICFACMTIVLFMPQQFVRIFVPAADAAFMEEALFALRVFLAAFVVRWLPFATQAFMVAVGQSRLASTVSVGQALVCPLVALVVLWPLGLTGLWLNMPVSSAAAGLLDSILVDGQVLTFCFRDGHKVQQTWKGGRGKCREE